MLRKNRVIVWTGLLAVGVFLATLFGRTLVSRAWSNAGMLVLAQALGSSASDEVLHDALAKAETLVQRALSYDAQNAAAHRAFGFILWERGARQEAGGEWRSGGIRVSDFERVARQARNAEELEKALDWYQRAIALEPARSDAYRSAAALLLEMDEEAQALIFIDKALALDAFSQDSLRVSAHYNRADILRRMGEVREAQAEYDWVLEQRPDDYWVHVHLGWLAWELDGDVERAEAMLLRAVEITPDLKWAYNRLGAFYEATDRPAEALRMYERALEIDPDDETARKRVKVLKSEDSQ